MRKHNQKIYYSAGLISIIILPIISILYLKNINAFADYRSLDIQMWNGKEENKATIGIQKYLNSKKFTVVYLSGDKELDIKKLNEAKMLVHQLIISKDSINGIRFNFGEKSKYNTYVEVLNILIEQNSEFYVPYKNDIWFANPKPRKINKNIKYIEPIYCCLRYNYIEEVEKINWNEIKELIRKYYLPIIMYSLMLIFTIRRIYNSNKNGQKGIR